MESTLAAVFAATGDLTSGWSWTVWLLIPLALALAVLTALTLGPLGEPPPTVRRGGGVSQYLERHAEGKDD